MAKDTAESKITTARVQLLLEQPFFGTLILYLEPVEKKSEDMLIPTMSTDGTHLYYCSEFVMGLTQEQLKFVLVHEVGHVALSHLARRQARIPMKWNWAADFAVNDLIVNTTDQQGRRIFTSPPGILLNQAWHDESAEQIYGHLPDPPGGDGQGEGEGEGEGQGQGQGKGKGKGKDKGNCPGPTLDDHSEWDNWEKDQSSAQKEQEWKDRLARATVEARSRGKMPGGWQTVIDDFLEPKMEWKAILMDTIVSNAKNDYRLFPPNKKHIWRGIYLPSMRGEEINIMFGCDVSGSISDEEIHEALSEVKGICDQFSDYTIYLRAFDTEIHNRWELHPFEPVPMVVTGWGGTDFNEICREAEKTPGISTLIIFTDLEAPFPDEVRCVPVIWLSVSGKKAPWGLTIQYPRKDE
jgi:predicted metal-dependent peptidase